MHGYILVDVDKIGVMIPQLVDKASIPFVALIMALFTLTDMIV